MVPKKKPMSEKKYYTPEIEEFHVEFEYQWQSLHESTNDGWIDQTFFLNVKQVEDLYRLLLQNRIRVPLLDREQIINLGWIKHITDPGYMLHQKEVSYHLTEIRTERILVKRFFHKQPDNGWDWIYLGKCKNKSKLRMLMKDLGINQ